MSPEFLVTTLIVVASPGTGVVFTLGAGLSGGARASILAAFACTLGVIPHMLAAITGLAALLHASAVAFDIVKYLGVAYLLYLAWRTLRADGPLAVEAESTGRSTRQVITAGILVNLLNPKLSIFFVAFLPQFVSTGGSGAVPQMLGLSAVFMAATFVVFATYGVLAASVRDRILGRPRVMAWMRRTFAATFVALGVRLAVTER